MNKSKTFVSILLLFFIGCHGSPMSVSLMTTAELQEVSNEQLCAGYAFAQSEKIRHEIERRNLFSTEEWKHIETESIYIGMSKLAMLATVKNVYFNALTTTQNGVMEQWKTLGEPSLYIYLLDDKVVSWSML